jgi:hypothetical protein
MPGASEAPRRQRPPPLLCRVGEGVALRGGLALDRPGAHGRHEWGAG